MSRYLSALKISKNLAGPNQNNLNNLSFPSSLGSLGSSPTAFENNQASNDDGQIAANNVSFTWLLHFTGREPVIVTFSPEVIQVIALANYPSAVAVDLVNANSRQTVTELETVELRQRVMGIYQEDADDDRNEALRAALADPDHSLICYRVMTTEQGIPLAFEHDDRRSCSQCAVLRGSTCTFAIPGGLVSARQGYSPVLDLAHRCQGYLPGLNDTDKRTGRERWPGLLENERAEP